MFWPRAIITYLVEWMFCFKKRNQPQEGKWTQFGRFFEEDRREQRWAGGGTGSSPHRFVKTLSCFRRIAANASVLRAYHKTHRRFLDLVLSAVPVIVIRRGSCFVVPSRDEPRVLHSAVGLID
jgi:hypothetical protein